MEAVFATASFLRHSPPETESLFAIASSEVNALLLAPYTSLCDVVMPMNTQERPEQQQSIHDAPGLDTAHSKTKYCGLQGLSSASLSLG